MAGCVPGRCDDVSISSDAAGAAARDPGAVLHAATVRVVDGVVGGQQVRVARAAVARKGRRAHRAVGEHPEDHAATLGGGCKFIAERVEPDARDRFRFGAAASSADSRVQQAR